MKNYIFLLPLYDDWRSLQKLLKIINKIIKKINIFANFIIVDDYSKISKKINTKGLSNINEIKVIRLKKNLGSQKAISIGLKYINKFKKESIVTVLDSDGEDDPAQIKAMINQSIMNPDKIIVSCRSKRKEGWLFKILYFTHKLVTFIFTFNWISFGNYASFNSKLIPNLLSDYSSWFALSSSYAKNSKLLRLHADRKKRYYGKSKLSFNSLVLHAIRINCIFLSKILLLSIFYLFLVWILYESLFEILLFIISIYIFLIIIVHKKTDPNAFYASEKFIKRIYVI